MFVDCILHFERMEHSHVGQSQTEQRQTQRNIITPRMLPSFPCLPDGEPVSIFSSSCLWISMFRQNMQIGLVFLLYFLAHTKSYCYTLLFWFTNTPWKSLHFCSQKSSLFSSIVLPAELFVKLLIFCQFDEEISVSL